MRKIVFVILSLIVLSGLSFAQTKGGDIYGSVTFADGSGVPGVMVKLTNSAIGMKTTISSERGNFRFQDLPPGSYELKFELQGFKTVVRRDIDIIIGRSVNISVRMETIGLM